MSPEFLLHCKNNLRGRLFVFVVFLIPCFSSAQDSLSYKSDDLFDLSLEELLKINVTEFDRKLRLYGYINTNAEQQFSFPSIAPDGTTLKEDDPFTWDTCQGFSLIWISLSFRKNRCAF